MSEPRILHLGPIRLQPRIIVYATIIQLTAFALLGSTEPVTRLAWQDLLLISLGPMFALALAHTFSEVLDHQIRASGHLAGQTLRKVITSNLQFLYVGLVPLVVALVLMPTEMTMNEAINIIFLIGVISLFVWGAVAARISGRSLGKQLLFGLGYGIVGSIVVVMELILRH